MNEKIENLIETVIAGEWGNPEGTSGGIDIGVIRSANFAKDHKLNDKEIAIRSIQEKKINNKLLKKGDILIEKSGGSPTQPVGRVLYYDLLGNHTCSNFISLIRPLSNIDSKFLYYTFCELYNRGVVKNFQQQTTGIINLQLNEYLNEHIFYPSLPEQKKIAEIISGIDKSLNGIISKKIYIEQTRRALIQQLTRGLHHTGQRKNSGTEFGLIPSDWNCELVPECCKLENKKRKPIKADDRKKMRGKYPYHGATKIQDYISEYSYEGEYTLIGEDGDHFSKYDSWEMAQYAIGKFNVSNHAHVIGSTNKCNSKWLYYSMLHRDLTLYLTRQGATRFKLSKASLEEVPVLFPPMKEQIKMISIFETFSKLIHDLDKEIIKLSTLKKGISSDLLSGRKRVNI